MLIRLASLSDESQVFKLLKEFPEEEGPFNWQAGAPTFRRIVENSQLGKIYVAEEGDGLVGLITLSFPTCIRCCGPYASIEEFIVSDCCRGKGVGGKLLKNAIEEANSRGCAEIQVNNPSKMGYPLYLHYGFKDIGKHLKMSLTR